MVWDYVDKSIDPRTMKSPTYRLLLVAASIATAVSTSITASAAVISSESYWTQATPSGGSYGAGGIAQNSSPDNTAVVQGNTGFNATNKWLSQTSAIGVINTTSLSGSVVQGTTQSGSVDFIAKGVDRTSNRQLASVPTLASTYYLSGLVKVGALANLGTGEYLTSGFLGSAPAFSTINLSTGFHYGVRNVAGTVYLAVFAGGNAYNLLALDSTTVTNTYQIVLKLDVNASGVDTLTAWYATNNASSLTQGLAATSVETWTGASSLDYYALQSHTTVADNRLVYFDEMRLGTALADVTTIPEPATVGLSLLGGILVLLMRRRKAV